MFKKGVFMLSFLVLAFLAQAQDSLWHKIRFDEKLSVALPGHLLSRDTLGQKVMKGKTKTAIYYVTCSRQNSKLKVTDRELLSKTYTDIVAGFLSKTKKPGFSDSISACTVGKTEGRRVQLLAGAVNEGHYAQELDSYLFLVDDKLYCIGVAFRNKKTEADEKDLKKFLDAVLFSEGITAEPSMHSQAEVAGYKAGHFLGLYVFPVALVGLLVFFFIRRKKKKQNP
jgi:hypothetical protein